MTNPHVRPLVWGPHKLQQKLEQSHFPSNRAVPCFVCSSRLSLHPRAAVYSVHLLHASQQHHYAVALREMRRLLGSGYNDMDSYKMARASKARDRRIL
ncbi:predicted protein [Sclerotinia sclerotiorum 1980 UF-70]|uniref:Uncharacterized protein n=1 Tax=Sclerotinia sclerotiorum (strain ATCC 18683 / 1980 / Ss-1) TaxID=665079 RepID=A7EZ50_SCLS1|nr:predicted protein [Sclerotinia sclerotiorum 1980 UF-70]EDN94742.1 predicted protein [Sclerotinia sclerotiorum 1980 UF-70]